MHILFIFNPKLVEIVEKKLGKLGVKIISSENSKEIQEDKVLAEKDGAIGFDVNTIIWSVGVKGR